MLNQVNSVKVMVDLGRPCYVR